MKTNMHKERHNQTNGTKLKYSTPLLNQDPVSITETTHNTNK